MPTVVYVQGYIVLAFGGILSLCQTLERFCGLENVARASIDIVASRKLVKLQFAGNYP